MAFGNKGVIAHPLLQTIPPVDNAVVAAMVTLGTLAIGKLFEYLIANAANKAKTKSEISAHVTDQAKLIIDSSVNRIDILWKRLDETEEQLHTAQIAALETQFWKDRYKSLQEDYDRLVETRKLRDSDDHDHDPTPPRST